MTDSEIVWISMFVMSLIIGFLFLFVKPDEKSIEQASRINPMGGLFRYPGWKYTVVGMLFLLSALSFALFKGWID